MQEWRCYWECTMLLLLLSHISRVLLCATPYMAAYQAPVSGILQARILEWVAISFSSSWKWKVKVKSLSRVWFFATPWTVAYQAPPSMGFPRQEYWRGVPLPSPTIQLHKLKYQKGAFVLRWAKTAIYQGFPNTHAWLEGKAEFHRKKKKIWFPVDVAQSNWSFL